MKRRRAKRVRTRRVTDYETCPDCSARNAVSFTFGRLEARAQNEPEIIGGSEPVVSWSRERRVRSCETCGGTGRVRVEKVAS
jgi:hypothetical protein